HHHRAVLAERNDVVRILAVAFHAWGAHRHPAHADARDLRLVLQHALHEIAGHVALDDVALDDARVAAHQLARHAQTLLVLVELRIFDHRGLEAERLQVILPLVAAAAARILANPHERLAQRRRARRTRERVTG